MSFTKRIFFGEQKLLKNNPHQYYKKQPTMSASVTKLMKTTSKFLVDYNAEVIAKLTEALSLSEQQVALMTEALKVDDMIDLKKLSRRGGSKSGTTRAPTEYNKFVQRTIKQLKSDNPSMDRKLLMKEAAAAWTAQKQEAAGSPKKKAKK